MVRARIVRSVVLCFHRDSSFSLYEGTHGLRLERPCCSRRQMPVWLRVWVIQTLLRGVNSIRGQNPLGLGLDVRLSRLYCRVGFEDLYHTAGGIIDLCNSRGPGGGRVITVWTAESSIQILGVRRSAVYRWKPGIFSPWSTQDVWRRSGSSFDMPFMFGL